MPIETYKCLIFRGSSPILMDGLQIRITRCIVIGRLSKQQQAIRGGHSLTPQTFALLPEMACCCFESRPMTMQSHYILIISPFVGRQRVSPKKVHVQTKWNFRLQKISQAIIKLMSQKW
jgi:hypothetical protein